MVLKKPDWIKVKIEGSSNLKGVENLITDLKLHTVCHSANCPNRMECFERSTATFMILGDKCTRNCRYCNVECARPQEPDPMEPQHIAEAVEKLKLKHAVITSVTRDDLPDEGAHQFREVIERIHRIKPPITVEVLIPDMHARHDLLDIVFDARPDVMNHNVEAAPSVFQEVRPQGNFEHSLEVLRYGKEKGLVTKSGFMVGLGESFDDVVDLLKRLREVSCDMVTIGQYLQPSRRHIEVAEYIHPDVFKEYEKIGYELGFKRVASGPFVRSSYGAEAL